MRATTQSSSWSWIWTKRTMSRPAGGWLHAENWMKQFLAKNKSGMKKDFDIYWRKLSPEAKKVCTAMLSCVTDLTQFQEAEAKAKAANTLAKASKVCPPHHLRGALHMTSMLCRFPPRPGSSSEGTPSAKEDVRRSRIDCILCPSRTPADLLRDSTSSTPTNS